MLKWTKSRKLAKAPKFTLGDFQETLDGGQAFRWKALSPNEYEGVFSTNVARLKLADTGEVYASFPENIASKKSEDEVLKYLDCNRNYQEIISAQTDPKAKNAAKEFPTLRILRQDINDAIICFICSSSKRIVQIKQCVNLLAHNLGENITSEHKTLPSFAAIADAPDQILKDCKLGFRAAYLKKTAKKIIADKFDTESLRHSNYSDAKKYLLTLSGIGEKVADCILLFGTANFEAFPVDTWISKSMSELYGLKNPKDARSFANKKFSTNAGFIQQLLFAAIRKNIPL